jgi:single-strand DNA-binding protein
MDLNKATIIGRLTRDPEVKTTPQGVSVCSFGVATNFVWSDQQGQKQERVEFHNVVAWRKLADICGQYLRKGSKIYLEGRLQTREWQGQDGNKRQKTEIVADNMIMLDSRGSQVGQGNLSSNSNTIKQSQNPNITPSTKPANNDLPVDNSSLSKKEEVSVEDIPF